MDNRIENVGSNIAMFGVKHSNAGDIVGKLEIKVRILAADRADRTGFFDQLHRLLEFTLCEDLVALNIDLFDADFRSLVNFERHRHGIGRNVVGGRLDAGILVPFLGEHHLDDRFRLLDLAGIVGRLLGDRRFLFSQLFQDFRIGDRVQTLILDAADRLLLLHPEDDDFSDLTIFFFNADVIEVALSVEPFNVATYDVHVQAVARLSLKLIFDCVLRNPTVIRYSNVFYTVRIESLQRLWLNNAKNQSQQHCKDH